MKWRLNPLKPTGNYRAAAEQRQPWLLPSACAPGTPECRCRQSKGENKIHYLLSGDKVRMNA
jgi:hypothetical protein